VKWDSSAGHIAYILDKRALFGPGGGPYTMRGWSWAVDQSGHMMFELTKSVNSGGGTETYYDTAQVEPNTWTHAAVTIDLKPLGSYLGQFYLNGLPTLQFSTLAHKNGLSDTGHPLLVGTDIFYNGWWKGCLDEVEIFHRVLAPAEILAIHAAGPGGKCKCFCMLVPRVQTFFSGDASKGIIGQFFNYSSEAFSEYGFHYNFGGWSPASDFNGAAVFNPPSGGFYPGDPPANYIPLPPFSIVQIPATIMRPSDMTTAGQHGNYEMIAGPGFYNEAA
jgi:hypothetical protein